MAVTKIIQPEGQSEGKIVLEFNNGDFQALQKIIKKWHFKDEESALRFGMAALIKGSEAKGVAVMENGKLVTLTPADSLLELSETEENTEVEPADTAEDNKE